MYISFEKKDILLIINDSLSYNSIIQKFSTGSID